MKADMSERITGAAIPDDVMAEAVNVLMQSTNSYGGSGAHVDRRWGKQEGIIRLLLSILTPTIEEKLIEELIGQLHARAMQRSYERGVEYVGLNEAEDGFVDICVSFLPTEDEEKKW